ncbi:helix-turn-helix domain-containing protein [Streptomyces sp. A5-4]|uniref:helix-turn-helix domain-containing protein n=1 Tax=Streptomyces sp. A5-4 TaxID=3384771 RepID=UPI003DA91F1E
MSTGSGRSYGALARRVGVSASTLHRYCSGRAVPMEFAPVERLARLCGCEGEDLIALHRLWVMADAQRRRRQEAAADTAAGRGAAATPTPAPKPAASDDVRPEAGDAGPADEPVRDDAQRAEDTVGGVAPPAQRYVLPAQLEAPPAQLDATHHADGDDAAPGRSPAPPTADADGAPSAVHEMTPVGDHAIPPVIPWHRRRATYASAALVAVLVTFALLAAFVDSPGSRADRRSDAVRDAGGTASESATPRGKRSGSASPSASPEPTASGGKADKRPGGAASAGKGSGPKASASAGRSADASTAPRQGGGTPFSWSTDSHIWRVGCGQTYLLDRAPDAVPPPPAQADAAPWARSVDAVHGDETGVRISVQGKTDTAVVLQSLQVRVAARRAPLKRNAFRMDPGCGGSITPRQFEVNLDMPRPIARSVRGNDSGNVIPAVSFPYKVSATDPELLLVTSRTVNCDCDWYLELEWSSGSLSGSVRIDNNGRPFRTSGTKGRPTYDFDHTDSRSWIPAAS